jgi:hypothetical protein
LQGGLGWGLKGERGKLEVVVRHDVKRSIHALRVLSGGKTTPKWRARLDRACSVWARKRKDVFSDCRENKRREK